MLPRASCRPGSPGRRLFNAARALFWVGIQAGWLLALLAFSLRRQPGGLRNTLLEIENLPIWIAAGMVMGTTAVLVLYLAAHPGYLTPLVAGCFVLAAAGWENLRLRGYQARGLALVLASTVTSVALFFGARLIRNPATPGQAIADGVLLQYSRDGVEDAVFHTTTEWLMLAGRGDLAPQERVDYVKRKRQ